MPIQEGETGGTEGDESYCNRPSGWFLSTVLAHVVVADPTRSTAIMDGDGGGVRARCTRLATDMKFGKLTCMAITSQMLDAFVPLAVQTYGCLGWASDGFLGTCARRDAELWA
jgi:hypothetical protein